MGIFENLFGVILALFFVLLNGFFVLSEFSLVKLRHTQAEKIKNIAGWRGNILFRVHEKLDVYLSTCQIGITFASLGLGWIGEPVFASLLRPILELPGVFSEKTLHFLAFLIAFSLISFLHIVVGELMPKSMAIRRPERMSLITAGPLFFFYWMMYPAVTLLNKSSNGLLKIFKLHKQNYQDHIVSAEEIKLILKTKRQSGELSHKEVNTFTHLLKFYELQVSDLMRPLHELVLLNEAELFSKNFRLILKNRFSRYPVYRSNKDNVIGILHTKDLLPVLYPLHDLKDIKPFLRPALRVMRMTNALDLLENFRRGKTHLALVYEANNLVGFVTFDHLLQALVGRIQDEFNTPTEDWIDLPDGSYLIKGIASIYVIERLLDIDLSHYPVTTVTGLILHEVQQIPSAGTQIRFDRFTLSIEKRTDPTHIWVRLLPQELKLE